jgi:hypothetical protein
MRLPRTPAWVAATLHDEAEQKELLKAKRRVKARVAESARLGRAGQ